MSKLFLLQEILPANILLSSWLYEAKKVSQGIDKSSVGLLYPAMECPLRSTYTKRQNNHLGCSFRNDCESVYFNWIQIHIQDPSFHGTKNILFLIFLLHMGSTTNLILLQHTRLKTQTKCCLALRHYMLPPGEVLLYPNEKARDLYIISKGFIQVVHQGKKVGVFGEGRYFGMSGLLFGINTDFMFITLTHCQVLCLSYDSFFSLVQSNERFYQEILLLSPQVS